jgi:transcription-repair coupling factor (superfamily II helicase)
VRAAFAVAMNGKQVLMLAPTTILAEQHWNTFRERMRDMPVRVEMISRFRAPKEVKQVLADFAEGKVDILIGTHRVLSRDVIPKELGLVIVDEEQRFGVAHKERIKQLRKKVDVLTMTATPIPRTLNMSLAGIRDMSVIETPPRDRLAIQTQVVKFDRDVIARALRTEIERGGQIYFVHNRVESIYSMANLLTRIMPELRLAVGHGQMGEGELERVMVDFVAHKFDVLLATTIVENGLDISNANTIIVNRADRYGLAQLYQLRGRVGRSDRRAYAYLLIPSEQTLTPVARRRLAAIREFSDLGSGFRIAALDLEIRGAGNLLGGEQSGHIEAVGFELYTQMLERAVREVKGEAAVEETEIQLNLGLNIRIPSGYIKEENQRLRVYKRVAGVETESQLHDVRSELTDRYGEAPREVRNLLEYASLKLQAMRVGATAIERKRELLNIKFRQNALIDPGKLARFVASQRGSQFTPDGTLKFSIRPNSAEGILQTLRDLLEELAAQEAPAEAT